MLDFTEENIAPFQKLPINPPLGFVVAEEEKPKDGPFQKSLCYTSYGMMVFVAFCAFQPGHLANAAVVVSNVSSF
ncbi:MAG: hypothetical protein AAF423_03370 [Pseudomonadota bacterium]